MPIEVNGNLYLLREPRIQNVVYRMFTNCAI